jgi:glutamate racemase
VKKELPIGIFDSGIGGLTVANAIKKALPKESILYFGDTEHLPYGEKSSEAIQQFSKRITEFLIEKGCKLIIIACNTASSVAHKVVKDTAHGIPVVNVIDPVVKHVATHCQNCHIGVIGTKGTTNSKVYPKKLQLLNAKADVTSLATPLLAPMIEEGFFNDQLSQTVIDSYLSNPELKDIDKLILACTHYPLIQEEIQSYYQGKVDIIDSASQVAEYVKQLLKKEALLSDETPTHHFYVSDYTDSFEKAAKLFFHEEIHLKEVKLTP